MTRNTRPRTSRSRGRKLLTETGCCGERKYERKEIRAAQLDEPRPRDQLLNLSYGITAPMPEEDIVLAPHSSKSRNSDQERGVRRRITPSPVVENIVAHPVFKKCRMGHAVRSGWQLTKPKDPATPLNRLPMPCNLINRRGLPSKISTETRTTTVKALKGGGTRDRPDWLAGGQPETERDE